MELVTLVGAVYGVSESESGFCHLGEPNGHHGVAGAVYGMVGRM